MKSYFLCFTSFLFVISTYSSYGQCDCLSDQEGPEVQDQISEFIIEGCNINFEVFQPEASDNCSTGLQYELAVDTIIQEYRRKIKSAEYILDNSEKAMTLFLPQGGTSIFQLIQGELAYNTEEGTAIYTGVMEESGNSEGRWSFYLLLENRMSSTEWLNQPFPTSWRDDFNLVSDEYLYWDYYTISPESYMEGEGDYAGSYLSIQHAPGNFYYAWQEGLKGSNTNSNNGSSGWFVGNGDIFVEGELVPESGNGVSGSLYFDFEDCQIPQYSLTWTISDDCGNSTTHHQTITVEPGENSEGCNCGIFGCLDEDAANYTPYATLSNESCIGCIGDFNADGTINSGDLGALLTQFGCQEFCDVDLNDDGFTNTADLALLLIRVGESCQ